MALDQFKKINQQLVDILNELLATGDWQASLFLRTAEKKLQALQHAAEALSQRFDSTVLSEDERAHLEKQKQGYIKVFVSLYQSDPHNLTKWANTLKTIREHSINRPIYRSEEHAQEMIRSKQGSPHEGFAVVYIQPTDIIPPYTGKLIEDRWGHELLTLRDNSLQPANVIEFVHQSGRYAFAQGKLRLKE